MGTQKEFIAYFRECYGKDGLYPMPHLTDEMIIMGINARGDCFEGDSFDRECIRDFIYKLYFKRSNTEYKVNVIFGDIEK